ncbi:enoyl-CoA hydratase/isomerase family protein [Neobacillus citreus]|uniref:Enoyl-CoA hydratase/isomerase family protein n=1 Tax=Neobacillus citreus TaxID=2833578 RepID=A0A942T2R8_9BACI|nr:enoyl-CoA hydratase/isomerase family protein [Neobacillus citreus]MCH6267272.1 enoyl-CoA hydratase/isomerase family protein [Neobacillus citreus]
MKYRFLDVWVDDCIAHVLLNNPENHNQFNPEMAQELLSLARDVQERDDIKVIVLGARGKCFSSGLPAPDDAEDFSDEAYSALTLACAALEEWARLPVPIIAAIKGYCASLGLSLACIADIRYATENAVFSVPESTWGRVPAGGITQRLPRLIGKGPAMSMLLGGDVVQAHQAFHLGLVNKLIEDDLLWVEACNKAKQLVNMSTLSLQYTKECLLRGSELPLEQALRLELDIYMLLQTSQDRMEGVRSFLEKRTPNFIGE